MPRIAVGQLRPDRPLAETVAKIVELLKAAALDGVDILCLPEAALTGYVACSIAAALADPTALAAAETAVRAACREARVACVLGTPFMDTGDGEGAGVSGVASGGEASTEASAGKARTFNSAVLIGKDGAVVGRQHKMQLVPPDRTGLPVEAGGTGVGWACAYGHQLSVFELEEVPCSVVICHDVRFPELCRLPVLAGARVIFFIACEQWHDDKPLNGDHADDADGSSSGGGGGMGVDGSGGGSGSGGGVGGVGAWGAERFVAEKGVYSAQIQARAAENCVWLAKANVSGCRDPVDDDRGLRAKYGHSLGSHGSSCIVDPTGVIVAEASCDGEEFVSWDVDLGRAHGLYAHKSALPEYFLRDWWAAGVARVTDARPSAQPPPPQTPQTHTRTQTQTPPREPPPPAPTAAAVVLRPAAAAVLHKSSGPASGGAAVTGVTPGAAAAMKDVDTRVRALGFGSLEELLMSLEGRRASC